MTMERMIRGLLGTLLVATAVSAETPAASGSRKLAWTTQSSAAREGLLELQRRIESYQVGPVGQALGRKIVEADPEFALGEYYLSAILPAGEAQQHLDRAVQLASKASDGERRFVEALVLARGQNPQAGLEPLEKLSREFPDERPLHMLLGQLYATLNRIEQAESAYRRAMAIDDSTPRARTLLGACHTLKGDYAQARAIFEGALATMPEGAAPVAIRYGIALTHLYQDNPEAAVASLETSLAEYRKSEASAAFPEVFLWNAIARIHLENGRPEQAIAAYEKGYASVPGSNLPEDQKQLWLGRLHHGRGRALARMGRHDEAWQAVTTVKAMIDEGGEKAQQYLTAYHYLAGYVKLEAGDLAAAVEHLRQSDQTDPFQKLLLARAWERQGESAKAQTGYQEILQSTGNNLDRALAFSEAKRKAAR